MKKIKQWELVLALAMHKLNLTTIDITPADVEAYEGKYTGGGLVIAEKGEVISITLATRDEAAATIVQLEKPRIIS